MKKLNFKIRTVKDGSALLIAILVMGILLTLTLGLSDLVIREIRQTSDVVAAGKAYFAAEAGIENALLDLHENLPGYDTKNSGGDYVTIKDPDTDLDARYSILNKASAVPFFDPSKPIFVGTNQVPTNINFVYSDNSNVTYNELPLSESVVIPLYSSDNDGNNYQNVTDFLIEYYVAYKDNDTLLQGAHINPAQFANLDVLRWKIFGKPDPALGAGDPSKTDAISDFFPSSYDATSDTPMCIGTDQSLQPTGSGQGCLFPVFSSGPGDNTTSAGSATGHLWGAARECYTSDSGGGGGSAADIQKGADGACTIQNFIEHHVQNYLVLTNVINPDVLLPGQALGTPEAKAKFKIHYRIIAAPGVNPAPTDTSPKLVREAATVTADGFAANGQVKQSIDVKINQSSFLPVFNFSLYHTCTKPDPSNPNCPGS